MPLSDLLATKKEQPDVSRLVDAGELYPAKSVSAERYHSIRHKTVRRWLRETLRVSEQEAERYAEGLRAVYVLKCRLPLLTGWLDLLGLEHEDGILTQDEIPVPDADELKAKVETFRGGDDPSERELLLPLSPRTGSRCSGTT